MVPKPKFVIVVDGRAADTSAASIELELQTKLGLVYMETFWVVDPEGAHVIVEKGVSGMSIAEEYDLIVFVSTHRGDVTFAIDLSMQIKNVNPNCRIIFRSIEVTRNSPPPDPVFDSCLSKSLEDNQQMYLMISEFMLLD